MPGARREGSDVTVAGTRRTAGPAVDGAMVQRWLAPVPAARLAVVRWLCCAYALVFLVGRAPYLWQAAQLPAGQWRPVGVLSGLDQPPAAGLVLGAWAAAVGAAIVVLAARLQPWDRPGHRARAARVALPVLAVAFLVVETYDCSWGQLFHTSHLPALHLLVLAGASLLDAGGRAAAREPSTSGAVSGWPLRLMTAVTALTYLIAGVAKLRLGGWDWLDGAALQRQVAFDNVRKELVGSPSSPLAATVVGWGWLWPPVALGTVAVELGAPLAVLRADVRRVWVAVAWTFHLGVVALMAIVFFYPVSGVAYASMLPVERLLSGRAAARTRRHKPDVRHTNRSERTRRFGRAPG